MKIIFLDIDWVLNSASLNPPKEYQSRQVEKASLYWSYRMDVFDTQCVENLKLILEKTNAFIVISSAWRTDMEQCKKSFSYDDLDWGRVFGKTQWPFDERFPKREDEILAFINSPRTAQIKRFVVLEDEHEMPSIEAKWNFIRTDWRIWLTREDAMKAIAILNS
jgi:hypothetical protein